MEALRDDGYFPYDLTPDAATGLTVVGSMLMVLWAGSLVIRWDQLRKLWARVCTDEVAIVPGVGPLLGTAKHLRRMHLSMLLRVQAREAPAAVNTLALAASLGEVTTPTTPFVPPPPEEGEEGAPTGPPSLQLRSEVACTGGVRVLYLYGVFPGFIQELSEAGLAATAVPSGGGAAAPASVLRGRSASAGSTSYRALQGDLEAGEADVGIVQVASQATVTEAGEAALAALPPGLAARVEGACVRVDAAPTPSTATKTSLLLKVPLADLASRCGVVPPAEGGLQESVLAAGLQESGRVPLVVLMVPNDTPGEAHWLLGDVEVKGEGESAGVCWDTSCLVTTPDAGVVLQRVFGQDESEDKECVVCLTEPKDVLLLPCRHMVVCHSCFPNLNQCPICRNSFDSFLQVQYEQ